MTFSEPDRDPTMRRARPFASGAAALLLLVTCVGCSSGGATTEDSPASTPDLSDSALVHELKFDFSELPGATRAQSISLQIPSELAAKSTAVGKEPLVTSATVTGRHITGDLCAADVAFDLSDDALGTLRDGAQQAKVDRPDLWKSTTVDELASTDLAGMSNILGTPDLTSPEVGTYFRSDLRTAVAIRDCSSSPDRGEPSTLIAFPTQLLGNGPRVDIHALAQVGITFMKDGTVGISTVDVSDFHLAGDAKWEKGHRSCPLRCPGIND